MKIIKNINNNFAIAIDGANNTVIISGKGIGFGSIPREITDLSLIDKTYRNVDEKLFDLIPNISDEIVEVTNKIVDYARSKISKPLNQSLYFSLADHIEFAISRAKKGMSFSTKMLYEIQYSYEKEMEVGRKIVAYLNKRFKIYLNDDEAAIIAMHIVEAENWQEETKLVDNFGELVNDIIDIVENEFRIKVDKTGFNYFRFVTHIKYLLERCNNNNEITSENELIFSKMVIEYPNSYNCAKGIKDYLKVKVNWEIKDEELLYLILHINRLYSKEECNQ